MRCGALLTNPDHGMIVRGIGVKTALPSHRRQSYRWRGRSSPRFLGKVGFARTASERFSGITGELARCPHAGSGRDERVTRKCGESRGGHGF